MRLRRRKPDYKHIAELELDTGIGIPAPPQPKREMVPVREHALTTLMAKLDPKSGGYILEKNPARYYTGSACSSAHSMVPGAKWLVNDHDGIQQSLARGLHNSGFAAAQRIELRR